MIAASPQQVIDEARRLIEGAPLADKLAIADEFVSEGDWLHLVVAPTQAGVSALDFVDELERVESSLRAKFGDKILLIPAKP